MLPPITPIFIHVHHVYIMFITFLTEVYTLYILLHVYAFVERPSPFRQVVCTLQPGLDFPDLMGRDPREGHGGNHGYGML